MCRKLAGDETGLLAYYRFDETDGRFTAGDHTSNNNHAALMNMSSDEWEVSGAAIGDASVNDYAGTLELIDVLGSLTVDNVSGTPAGVHAYRVDEGPNVSAAPSGLNQLTAERYFGVFVAGGSSPTFDLTLSYSGFGGIDDEADLDLARRDDNADTSWQDAAATPDLGADTLKLSGETGTEYILGSSGYGLADATGAGRALELEASGGEHVLIPHSASLDVSGSTLTVEAWIHPESYPETFPTVMAKFNSASSWEFDVKSDNTVEWELFTTAQEVCNGGAITLGRWSHVAGTYDGTDLRVYVNGIEVASCPHGTPGPVGTNSQAVEIGSRLGGLGGFFDGKIDEARIWNVTRSEAEIRDTMCRKLVGDEAGLVAYFRMDETDGTVTAADRTSNNNHGALIDMSGGAWQLSGAAIGDVSASDYAGTIELTSVLGGITADNFSGAPAGVQAYRVDGAPNVTTAPAGLTLLSEERYFGIFIIGGSGLTYDFELDYTGHGGIVTEADLDLARRRDNADISWKDADAALDQGADTLTLTGESGTEYIVASSGTDNELPVELILFKILP